METRKKENKESLFGLSKIVLMLSVFVVGLLLAKIFVTNQLATTGAVASSHSTQLEKLKAENQKLQNEVSSLGSIQAVSSKADKLGLKSLSKIEILRSNANVAYQP